MEKELKAFLNKRFDSIDVKFDAVNTRFEQINARMDREFSELHGRFDTVHGQILSIRDDMATKEELGEQTERIVAITMNLVEKAGVN